MREAGFLVEPALKAPLKSIENPAGFFGTSKQKTLPTATEAGSAGEHTSSHATSLDLAIR